MNAMDVYNSFFRASEVRKTRSTGGIRNWPANRGSSDPVFNRSVDEQRYYWSTLTSGAFEDIAYTRNGQDNPNVCHHTWLRHRMDAQSLPTYTVQRWQGPASEGAAEVIPHTETRAVGAYVPTQFVDIRWDEAEFESRLANALTRVASEGFHNMLNIPQAIIELKDVPATARQLGDLLGFLRGLPRMRRRALASKGVRQVAKAYLADVFGIQPTIGDVERFCEDLPKRLQLSGRVVDYQQGQPIRSGFTLGGAGEIPNVPPTSKSESAVIFADIGSGVNICPADWLGQANTTTVAARGVTSTGLWPYGTQLGYRVSSVNCVCFARVARTVDWNTAVSALEDILAQAPPAYTAWQLLPFSFVVDWFADVSQWMRNANKLRVAYDLGLRLEDGVWWGRRQSSDIYYPTLREVTQGSLVYRSKAGNRIYFDAFGSSTKTVSYQLAVSEGSYTRDRYGDLRLPPLVTRGVSAQGKFQAATSLALCLA